LWGRFFIDVLYDFGSRIFKINNNNLQQFVPKNFFHLFAEKQANTLEGLLNHTSHKVPGPIVLHE
jgi:hypothetical protein